MSEEEWSMVLRKILPAVTPNEYLHLVEAIGNIMLYIKEIDRLNNIINELEKYTLSCKNNSSTYESKIRKNKIPKMYEIGICLGEQNAYINVLGKLKELKETSNESK